MPLLSRCWRHRTQVCALHPALRRRAVLRAAHEKRTVQAVSGCRHPGSRNAGKGARHKETSNSGGGDALLPTSAGNSTAKEVSAYRRCTKPSHKGSPGGCNRLLSARGVVGMSGIPERTVRDKGGDWGLPACRIGKHLGWKERDCSTGSTARPPE